MPERATVMSRSEKSAEAIVAARRRAEREGELEDMSLDHATYIPHPFGKNFSNYSTPATQRVEHV